MGRQSRRQSILRRTSLFVLVLISLTVVGVAFFAIFDAKDSPQSKDIKSTAKPENAAVIASDTLLIGDPKAPLTMIEYTDFKCPECNKYHRAAGKDIRKEYVDTGKLKIVFRPYPVFSEDGGKALGGSYCANQQGKFPEYHDALFEYMWDTFYSRGELEKAIEDVLTDSVMRSITESIDMDYAAYNTCLEDPATRAAYDADLLKAADDEIQGAPSFVVEGEKIVQNQPFPVFQAVIESKLR